MIILGIETSCDETACAILKKDKDRITILSNVVASSASLQAKYGGVIPEQAAREQIKSIIPVIQEALFQSNLYPPSSKHHLPSSTIHPPAIDAIAVTYGPGLIGSLLVGVETAKTLALVWKKPLIPVNHLLGHFYANWIVNPQTDYRLPTTAEDGRRKTEDLPSFPCLGLLVSGGHTDLVFFQDHGKYTYIGGTRDDSAGECFDKCARLLGLPYPGGPEISKLAEKGNPKAFDLPRPMLEKGIFSAKGGPSFGWDFSFSGLKTAVSNLLKKEGVLSSNAANSRRAKRAYPSPPRRTQDACVSDQVSGIADRNILRDLSASIEQAIVDVLVTKTIKAAQKYKVNQIIVAGGVAANQKLASELKLKIENLKLKINLHIPSANLCTDNAVMIATAAFFNFHPINPLTLQTDPNLSL